MSVIEHSRAETTGVILEGVVTPKQLELLALYASGYSYKEIGAMKFLSPYTIRNTLTLALRRSGARNLTHLCVCLLQKGMIRRGPHGDYYEPVQDLRVV